MAPRDLSSTQLEVILKLTAPGASGVLERRQGGFWTEQGVGSDERGVPIWYVTSQTVQAMERHGLLRRLYRYPEEWRDDRELTEAWLTYGLELEPNKDARQLKAEKEYAATVRSTAQDKIRRQRARLDELEAEKRTELSRLNRVAKAARARTVMEPTVLARGDRCYLVSEERQRALRSSVDAFYDGLRRDVVGPIDAEEAKIRSDIERTRDIAALQTGTARKASSKLRSMKRREDQAESDDAVEHEIDPDLIPVWRVVKRQFVDTPRMSRAEAFQHWVDENPDEVLVLMEERVSPPERSLEQEQWSEEARSVAERSQYDADESEPSPEEIVEADVGDVPFN